MRGNEACCVTSRSKPQHDLNLHPPCVGLHVYILLTDESGSCSRDPKLRSGDVRVESHVADCERGR